MCDGVNLVLTSVRYSHFIGGKHRHAKQKGGSMGFRFDALKDALILKPHVERNGFSGESYMNLTHAALDALDVREAGASSLGVASIDAPASFTPSSAVTTELAGAGFSRNA